MMADVKSFVVLGNARSGTSMTAGLLSILGVEMHEKRGPIKHPSQNPKGAFENVNFATVTSNMHKDLTQGLKMREIREKYDQRLSEMIRNHERALWGFKSAVTHHFLTLLVPKLRNPHLVIVFRCLLPNAQSWMIHMKQVFGKNVALNRALENMAKSQATLVREVGFTNCPKIYTTYEDLKKQPWREAVKIANFVGVDPKPKKREVLDFIMPNYTTLNSS